MKINGNHSRFIVRLATVAVTGFVGLLASNSADAVNLVLNPSFETATTQGIGATDAGQEIGQVNFTSANAGFGQVNSSGVANWSASGARIWYFTDAVGPGVFPHGTYAVGIDSEAGVGGIENLSQSGIALTAGTSYMFSFDFWGRVPGVPNNDPQLNVFLSGPATINLFIPATTSRDGSIEVESTTFTPLTSGSYTLNFQSANVSNGHSYIDNVLLEAAETVPEPSTYALGLIGLAGLGLVAWQRKRGSWR